MVLIGKVEFKNNDYLKITLYYLLGLFLNLIIYQFYQNQYILWFSTSFVCFFLFMKGTKSILAVLLASIIWIILSFFSPDLLFGFSYDVILGEESNAGVVGM